MLRMSADKLLREIALYLPEEVIKKLGTLNPEERKVFEYFLTNISVGELLCIRELQVYYKLSDPKRVIQSLVDKGLLESGIGSYSIAKPFREALIKYYMSKRRH